MPDAPTLPESPKPSMPGDDQPIADVAAWIRKHVQSEAVMVLRIPHVRGIGFLLAGVAPSGKGDRIYSPDHGGFDWNGVHSLADGGLVRLFIPNRDLVTWAISHNLWTPSGIVYYQRPPSTRQDDLFLKVMAQLESW